MILFGLHFPESENTSVTVSIAKCKTLSIFSVARKSSSFGDADHAVHCFEHFTQIVFTK